MKKVKVSLPDCQYQVLIGSGLLGQVPTELNSLGFKGKVAVVTNPPVRKLYGNNLQAGLEGRGLEVKVLEVPEGEEFKSLEIAGKMYGELCDFQAERSTPVAALGGGVVGDLAGFVAATWMRGAPLVHLPTSLLAQVDSSIGGKVAVNHGRLKNAIGCFYQPVLVVSDVLCLKTLPAREVENGLAEVIKYGVIQGGALFKLIEAKVESIKAMDPALLEEVIYRCAGIKADLVEKDEKDRGPRNVLNFGHTVGHAVETVSDFKIPHGRAVAVGMMAAATISNRMGLLTEAELLRLKDIIVRAGLPVSIPRLGNDKIMDAMQHDKKVVGGRLRFVLPHTIGEVFVTDQVQASVLAKVIEDLYEKA